MIRVYNIGSLAAQLQLTALHAKHGGVVRGKLNWEVIQLDNEDNPTDKAEQSQDAQPKFELLPGKYNIIVEFQEETVDLGTVTIERNTLTDAVFVLNAGNLFDSDEQYFAETDPFVEHDRRQADREQEVFMGEIVTPLKDPNRKPESGSGIQAHPLLSNQAQFDGMPPEVTPDPTQNEEASNKAELQLQQQMQNDYAAQASPTATPMPSH